MEKTEKKTKDQHRLHDFEKRFLDFEPKKINEERKNEVLKRLKDRWKKGEKRAREQHEYLENVFYEPEKTASVGNISGMQQYIQENEDLKNRFAVTRMDYELDKEFGQVQLGSDGIYYPEETLIEILEMVKGKRYRYKNGANKILNDFVGQTFSLTTAHVSEEKHPLLIIFENTDLCFMLKPLNEWEMEEKTTTLDRIKKNLEKGNEPSSPIQDRELYKNESYSMIAGEIGKVKNYNKQLGKPEDETIEDEDYTFTLKRELTAEELYDTGTCFSEKLIVEALELVHDKRYRLKLEPEKVKKRHVGKTFSLNIQCTKRGDNKGHTLLIEFPDSGVAFIIAPRVSKN